MQFWPVDAGLQCYWIQSTRDHCQAHCWMAVSDFRQPSRACDFLSFPGLMTRKHTGSKIRSHAPVVRARIGELFGQIEIEVWNICRTRSATPRTR